MPERIHDEALKLGFESKFVAKDPQRPNVLARYGSGKTGFALIGHIDTVGRGRPGLVELPALRGARG